MPSAHSPIEYRNTSPRSVRATSEQQATRAGLGHRSEAFDAHAVGVEADGRAGVPGHHPIEVAAELQRLGAIDDSDGVPPQA